MHRKRLAVAIVLIPLLYLYIMFLPAEYFMFLLVFISTLALMEFYNMCRLRGLLRFTGVACGAALLAVSFASRHLFPSVLLCSMLIIMSLRLFVIRDPSASLSEISTTVLGLLYIPGLLSFQLDLAKTGPVWIVMLYVSVWASDSMAYYLGKGIGKRKLYPEVSPNKTVAGAVGSVIGGALGAVFIRSVMMRQLPLHYSVLLGLAVGLSGIIGDLVESMFKRDAGIKDSSTIIPGHGGVLDKIDSVTFAGPAFYLLCYGLGLVR